jgi:hypothetical protein
MRQMLRYLPSLTTHHSPTLKIFIQLSHQPRIQPKETHQMIIMLNIRQLVAPYAQDLFPTEKPLTILTEA